MTQHEKTMGERTADDAAEGMQTPAEKLAGRRPARHHYREQALTLAADIAKAHTNLTYPADFTLHAAAKFADFLENGPKAEQEQGK